MNTTNNKTQKPPENTIYIGDCRDVLKILPDESVDTVLTSPPYWKLKDYGSGNQVGREKNPGEYLDTLNRVFEAIFPVLKPSGSLWINIGDRYKNKDLLGIPWRLILKLKDRGWILRNACIWRKTNPMPASVKDRLNNTYEFLFHLVKSRTYYYNLDPVRLPHKTVRSFKTSGRLKKAPKRRRRGDRNPRRRPGCANSQAFHPRGKNPGDVVLAPVGRNVNHPAVFPAELCQIPIKTTCPPDGILLDPFCGIGTALLEAKKLSRKFIGIDVNPQFARQAAEVCEAELIDLSCFRSRSVVGIQKFEGKIL